MAEIIYRDVDEPLESIGVTGEVSIKAGSSASTDAFGRWRVSNPVSLFDSTQQYDLGRVYWEEALSGSATSAHDANGSCVDLSVTASASDSAVRQTREYFRYQPGKSQLISMTGAFGAAASGVSKKYGYYDDENGIYFEQGVDGTYRMVKRSYTTGTAVDTEVLQTAWNLDNLSGAGGTSNSSGETLDGTKAQILIIDLQWLSVGRVRVGLEFGGALVYVHEFSHSNVITGAYMTTANLPLRYEISSDGTSASSFKTICGSVISEGGFEAARGSLFSDSNGVTLISVTTSRPILSIRPKLTFNSIVNRGLIVPSDFFVYTEDKAAYFTLVYGGTLTGASFASVNADSIVESDVAATAISGGITLAGFLVDKSGSILLSSSNRYPYFLDIAGAHPTSPYTDSLSIVAVSRSTATSCGGTLSWRETR